MAVPGMLPRVVPRRAHPFVVDGRVVPPGVGSIPILLSQAHINTGRQLLECERIR